MNLALSMPSSSTMISAPFSSEAIAEGGRATTSPTHELNAPSNPPSDSMTSPSPLGSSAAFMLYLHQRQEEIHAILVKNGISQTTIDMSSTIAEEWNNLDPTERRVWEDKAMSEGNSSSTNNRNSVYSSSSGSKRNFGHLSSTSSSTPSSKKRRRAPGAPKRPMSAYFDFANCRRAAVKRQNMHANNGEVSRILAAMWKAAPPEVKKPYTDREAANWARYKAKNEAYQFKSLSGMSVSSGIPLTSEARTSPLPPLPQPTAAANTAATTNQAPASPTPTAVSNVSDAKAMTGLDALVAACTRSVDDASTTSAASAGGEQRQSPIASLSAPVARETQPSSALSPAGPPSQIQVQTALASLLLHGASLPPLPSALSLQGALIPYLIAQEANMMLQERLKNMSAPTLAPADPIAIVQQWAALQAFLGQSPSPK